METTGGWARRRGAEAQTPMDAPLEQEDVGAGLEGVDGDSGDGNGGLLLEGEEGTSELDSVLEVLVGGLGGVLGEDNELLLVGLQASNVGIEGLLRAVLAAVVDGNTDGEGLALADASELFRAAARKKEERRKKKKKKR